MAELGQSVATVAATFHVTHKADRQWVERANAAGGLQERSCRPHSSPAATPPELLDQIERLRRQRWTSAQIAAALQLGRSTVARGWAWGASRRSSPRPPVQRYECAHAGELVHLDVKNSGGSRASAIGSRAIAAAGCAASAGRFIRTMLTEWAYARPYGSSTERGATHKIAEPSAKLLSFTLASW